MNEATFNEIVFHFPARKAEKRLERLNKKNLLAERLLSTQTVQKRILMELHHMELSWHNRLGLKETFAENDVLQPASRGHCVNGKTLLISI